MSQIQKACAQQVKGLQSLLIKLTMTMALLGILNKNHKNDNANLFIRNIATIVSSFITVDCCLVSPF
jgi:hypothetical protein